MKASKLLYQGCSGDSCYAINMQKAEEKTEDILLVYEFRYVFHEKLRGLPPRRAINLEIELVPGAQPISKAPLLCNPNGAYRIGYSVR